MAKRYMRFKDGKQRALTLSYDDGVVQDKRLIGIMDKYGLKGTFNINAGVIKEVNEKPSDKFKNRMNEEDILKTFKNSGHEVAIHGWYHNFWNEIPTSQVVHEVYQDRLALEEMFGERIVGGAYPFGTISATDDAVEVLRQCGIKYCRETDPSLSFSLPENWLRLMPTCHHNHPDLMKLVDDFLKGGWFKRPKLFYLWGHSYEFDDRDNWNVIEEFAKAVSGNETIWFATNIEIYEYVEAYKRLEYFADGKTVYNPTLIDLWMEEEGVTYKIPSGATVKIGE